MKHIILLLLITCLNFSVLFAQEANFEHVPKQYSVEFGGDYVFNTSIAGFPQIGYGAMFDYAWKLSGFGKKKQIFISVPIGYTMYKASATDTTQITTRRLNYGWRVRHEFRKDKKIVPFVSYALLLNSLSFDKIDGRVMGHQTKFDFGVDFHTQGRLIYFAKIEYSYASFPAIGLKKANIAHFAALKVGLRM